MGYAVKILHCHGGCSACYEADIRKCTPLKPYRMDKILGAIRAIPDGCNPPTIHGGEPLVFPIKELEILLKEIHGRWGHTGIQTSLSGLSQKHIDIFKKYQAHVGVSIDGDTSELNWGRWDALKDKDQVEKKTAETLRSMERLKKAGVRMSAIIVLRKNNADPYHISDLIRFIERLIHDFGITSIRCNELIAKNDAGKPQELTNEELEFAFSELMGLAFENSGVDIQPFRDVADLLMGHKDGTCTFSECDPYATTAERTILHDGSIGGCLKTGLGDDGIQGLSSFSQGKERYKILPVIDQKKGGCKDCEYWAICKGGCPGSGIADDWRNKTRFCEAYKTLFSMVSGYIRGLFPNAILSCDKPGSFIDAGNVVRSIAGSTWMKHRAVNIDELAVQKQNVAQSKDGYMDEHGDREHGDHTDKINPIVTRNGGK